MNRFKIFLCFLILVTSCNEDADKYDMTMKYISEKKGELYLDCISQKENGILQGKLKCYHKDGYLFLVENFEIGKRQGEHIEYYPNGAVRMQSTYNSDTLIGLSKHFYENGAIERIELIKNGEIFYDKELDRNGYLKSSVLPVYTNHSDKVEFKLGKPENIQVLLAYSMFDSLQVGGLIDYGDDGIYEDTIISMGRSFEFEFTPESRGKGRITGILVEIDAENQVESGKGIFEIDYFVK